MGLPQTSIVIMKDEEYLMYDEATVIFDSIEEAQDMIDNFFDLMVDGIEIKEVILFADAKVKWSSIKNEMEL
jgi:hypothetical protein